MKVCILGWGSLLWDNSCLNIIKDWKKTDIYIPLEYSRLSLDGRLTLVIDNEYGTYNNIWYTYYYTKNLKNKAVFNLKQY